MPGPRLGTGLFAQATGSTQQMWVAR